MFRIIFLFCCVGTFCFAPPFAVKSLQEIRNQNVVRQNFEESCGAAALATLLNLFKQEQYAELDILEKLHHKTDTLSFRELQQVASDLGYTTRGFQLSREKLEQTSYPLLVRIENDPRFPHFVVVVNYAGDFIRVLDPNFGEYISTKREFYSIWDSNYLGGYALIVARENLKPKIEQLRLPSRELLRF